MRCVARARGRRFRLPVAIHTDAHELTDLITPPHNARFQGQMAPTRALVALVGLAYLEAALAFRPSAPLGYV